MDESIITIFIATLAALCVAFNLDTDSKSYEEAFSACKSANSELVSFDYFDATCKNKAVIPFR